MAALLTGALGATPALAAGPFDGTWNVVVNCPTSGDVLGYVWRFPAQVRNSRLTGKYVNPGDPKNFGILGGAIGSGGDALLTMGGSTGLPDYSVGHAGQHTPIRYTVNAHFEATSGAGKRNEQRACDLSFSKS